ncbi:MAG: hypothetical protein MI743_16525 [Sneathiellales bacterium]|nr:hypothetical protein [Sneathiellales bacterium]
MIVGRIIAWILIAIGLILAGGELVTSLQAGEWAPQLLGQLWFELDSESLNLTQAIVQRYLLPELWDPVIVTILLWPAWVIFLVPGFILLLIFRKRSNRYAPKKYLD